MNQRCLEALAAFEDCLCEEEEWAGVPDAIRIAFRTVHAILKSQTSVMENVAEGLKDKVDKEDMKKAFKFKANIVDVEDSMDKVAEALDAKVSIEDLQGILDNYELKAEDNGPNQRQVGGKTEARLARLEDRLISNKNMEEEEYRADLVAVKELETVQQRLKVIEQLQQVYDQFATREEVDRLVREEVLPEVANQIREVQQGVKERFSKMLVELERRANMDDFVQIRKDIERIARDKDNSARHDEEQTLRDHISDMKSRIERLEPHLSTVQTLRSDMKTVMTVNKDIQLQLQKIAVELTDLPQTARLVELDNNLQASLKNLEIRVRKLESSDKRTQELIEILSQQRRDVEIDIVNRSPVSQVR